ncbi:MAG TPA: rod shape-determining protein MreC [Deltaproteobacteria bacterium]|jgi:rod shape-determining protein MreC|nr:rod shape-determining protein MreC [Deltaproteobacteria bacterium]HQJ07659.1 rod shape-determining protein MreC [Deltaproteobacteria bacterium]
MGRSNTRVILVICAAALVLVLLSAGQYGSSSLAISYVREGYYGFDKAVSAPFSFIARLWDTYIGLVNTSRENEELRKQIDKLRVQCMSMNDLRAENKRFRAMLDFKEAHQEYSLIPASLLSQDITLIFKTAIIDKGTISGFHIDMPILSPEGIVGKVVAVSPHTSQILLITDPNSAIPAIIESTRVKGIIKGRGGNLLSLEYVRRTENVKIGDCIVTSGLLGMFPKGLKIGYVQEVKRDVNKIFSDIVVKPCVEMDKIEGIFGIDQNMEVPN